MARPQPEFPPCYAFVHPGLESVAADEITRDLGGTVKKTDRGILVFRVPHITPELLQLRTVEDVFLLAWGSDALTYRTADLDKIRKWTHSEPDWSRLLQIHHTIRPKPKGKPTLHIVTQMTGEHGYRRRDARDALMAGLAGHIPGSWKIVEENAAVEIWLTIHGKVAVCGVRLSDRTMRHREYKLEHLPASLRPSLAAAVVRLGGAAPGHVVLDPMCGAGTILAEQMEIAHRRRFDAITILGGDIDRSAVQAARINLHRIGRSHLACWDAGRLPLAAASVDRVLCNPPFGKQLGRPEEIGPLYRRLVSECNRVLTTDGRAVLLVGEPALLHPAAIAVGWQSIRQLRVRVLGQPAALTVWRNRAQ